MSNLLLYRMLWIVGLASWFVVLVLVPLAVLVDAAWPAWTLVGWIVGCLVTLLVSVELWARRISSRE